MKPHLFPLCNWTLMNGKMDTKKTFIEKKNLDIAIKEIHFRIIIVSRTQKPSVRQFCFRDNAIAKL